MSNFCQLRIQYWEQPVRGNKIVSSAQNLVDIGSLWRYKGLVIVSALGSMLCGAILLTLFKPGFEVGARLWVERLTMPNEDAKAMVMAKDFIPTQAEIIRSPAVLNVALADLNRPLEDGTTYEQVLTSTMQRLTVDPLIGTNVLSVRFRDRNRQKAIETVQAVIKSYREYVRVTEKDGHRETLELLTQQDEELRGELKELHEQHRQLRELIADVTQVRESAKVRESLVADLSEKLSLAKSRRMKLEHHIDTFFSAERLAKIFHTPPVARQSESSNGDRTEYVSLRSKHHELENTEFKQAIDVLARMSREDWLGLEDPAPLSEALLLAESEETRTVQKYGYRHPKLIGVRNQIAELEDKLYEAVRSAPTALERELQSIRRHEEGLAEIYRIELASIQADIDKSKIIDSYSLRERHVLDEIRRVQASHDSISARMKQWELLDQAVADGRLGIVVRMLEEPSAVLTGIEAPMPLALGICGLIGFMVGALVVSRIDQNTQDHSEGES